ncbi:MAG: hypothetical protein M0P64_01160 [Candidatus Pacebacteria bacterium]|jgi:hypothetical protein|nr:hypothetical protein [Candidatus Paceibacterota bacterium]
MNEEIQKIIEEQLPKLPKEVVTFLSSASWDEHILEISTLYNLPEDEVASLKNEVIFVLIGLTPPDEFKEILSEETALRGSVLDAVVSAVENKIFAPVRPALAVFFEQEAALATEFPEEVSLGVAKEATGEEPLAAQGEIVETPQEAGTLQLAPTTEEIIPAPSVEKFTSPFSAIIQPTQVRTWEKTPEVVPDNLPTEDAAESFLPNLTPKTVAQTETTTTAEPEGHPFEEKMKKVFTAGQQSMGELAIEQTVPATSTPERNAPPIYHTDPYREPIE